jgi:hypothetical protein
LVRRAEGWVAASEFILSFLMRRVGERESQLLFSA